MFFLRTFSTLSERRLPEQIASLPKDDLREPAVGCLADKLFRIP